LQRHMLPDDSSDFVFRNQFRTAKTLHYLWRLASREDDKILICMQAVRAGAERMPFKFIPIVGINAPQNRHDYFLLFLARIAQRRFQVFVEVQISIKLLHA
jgi:hypothetical protein